jgi:hypothetical protein
VTSPPPQHDDPLGEGRAQLLQALAVLTTVGEAAARYAVAAAHTRASKAERADRIGQLADRADRLDTAALAAQDRATRRLIDKAYDEVWLNKANIYDTAGLWRAAAMRASTGDAHALRAMRLAEQHLHKLNPILIDAYHRHRAAGKNLVEAMHAAVGEVWQHEKQTRARPHGAKADNQSALRATPPALGDRPDPNGQRLVDELEAAVRAEVARLADGVDPELLDRLQRQWRSAGHAPAADAASLLATAARQLRADAAQARLDGPIAGTATIRRGTNHPSSYERPPATLDHELSDVPVHGDATGPEIVAQGLERAADEVRTHRAAASHLSGLSDQQTRASVIESDSIDVPATPVDEHHVGLDSGNRRQGAAECQRADAEQQRRLGRAFPPLTTLSPNPVHTPTVAMPTPRRGRTR